MERQTRFEGEIEVETACGPEVLQESEGSHLEGYIEVIEN